MGNEGEIGIEVAEPDLAELERQALARAEERASGGNRPDGHVVCDGLVRIYKAEGVEVVALQGLDLVVDRGELMALVGASGSGKSTLLNILAGLDRPTAGYVRVADHDLLRMPARERLRYRRRTVGMVWQQTSRNLLPYLTARDNVALPMRLTGHRRGRAARQRADQLLELVGAAGCASRRPAEMSGGEQLATAVAVAAANDPELLLADEPTGELDEAAAAAVFDALRSISAELEMSIIVVTHDTTVSEQVPRTVQIRDGRTSSEVRRTERTDGAGGVVRVAEEFALLDRQGRMQLPHPFVDALTLRERVRLNLASDHIEVRPGHHDQHDHDHHGQERPDQEVSRVSANTRKVDQ